MSLEDAMVDESTSENWQKSKNNINDIGSEDSINEDTDELSSIIKSLIENAKDDVSYGSTYSEVVFKFIEAIAPKIEPGTPIPFDGLFEYVSIQKDVSINTARNNVYTLFNRLENKSKGIVHKFKEKSMMYFTFFNLDELKKYLLNSSDYMDFNHVNPLSLEKQFILLLDTYKNITKISEATIFKEISQFVRERFEKTLNKSLTGIDINRINSLYDTLFEIELTYINKNEWISNLIELTADHTRIKKAKSEEFYDNNPLHSWMIYHSYLLDMIQDNVQQEGLNKMKNILLFSRMGMYRPGMIVYLPGRKKFGSILEIESVNLRKDIYSDTNLIYLSKGNETMPSVVSLESKYSKPTNKPGF